MRRYNKSNNELKLRAFLKKIKLNASKESSRGDRRGNSSK